MQTQIRLLFLKQSDLGLPWLLLRQGFCDMKSSPDNQYCSCEQKKKSVQNFRTFTLNDIYTSYVWWFCNNSKISVGSTKGVIQVDKMGWLNVTYQCKVKFDLDFSDRRPLLGSRTLPTPTHCLIFHYPTDHVGHFAFMIC